MMQTRELHNFFRWIDGFEFAQVQRSAKPGAVEQVREPASHTIPRLSGCTHAQPVGFARFSTREAAQHALDRISGVLFDPSSPIPLKAEFAKSNSRAQRITHDGAPAGRARSTHPAR